MGVCQILCNGSIGIVVYPKFLSLKVIISGDFLGSVPKPASSQLAVSKKQSYFRVRFRGSQVYQSFQVF